MPSMFASAKAEEDKNLDEAVRNLQAYIAPAPKDRKLELHLGCCMPRRETPTPLLSRSTPSSHDGRLAVSGTFI